MKHTTFDQFTRRKPVFPQRTALHLCRQKSWGLILLSGLLLFSWGGPAYADNVKPIPLKDGKMDCSAAMEQARQGNGEEMLRLTWLLAKQPSLLPPRKALGEYHQYLKDTNIFVQYYAVQVVAGLKDKSSAEPLRQFIMDLESHKADTEKLPRMERVALGFASATALQAYADLDDESSVSVKLLSSMLSHDIGKEWGGGVAHDALAKKGRAGLQALLEEARQPLTNWTNERQINYLVSAMVKFNDPNLAVDMYAACKDMKCHKMARNGAVFALSAMARQSSEAEQLLINLAEDEKFDQRPLAVLEVGRCKSPQALESLLKLERLPFEDTNRLQKALLYCDSTNRIPKVFASLLSANTPRAEKDRLWGLLESQGLQPYEKELRESLKVSDTNGVPLNELRVAAWMKLYQQTGTNSPVELSFDSEKDFQKAAGAIITEVHRRVYNKYRGPAKHSDAQMQQMAMDEVNGFVTKWESRKQETKHEK